MTNFSADDDIPESARGAAIALGNFDGVHRGHQAVIIDAASFARGAPVGVAVFTPHPRRFFKPDLPPFRLQSDAQRERATKAAGAQHVFDIRFDAALSQMSDAEFAERVLVQRFGVSHVGIGAEFRFGHGRTGDVRKLTELGTRLGFSVHGVEPIGDGGEKFSSTGIREAIAQGDVENAARMLGRPWAIEGVVQRGFARGRGFGFATANVALGEYVRPKLGVYAVRADIGDGVWRAGVASVGVNPTFEALPEPLLEAHLFDFDADLYGRTIEVQMAAFLREEAKFENAEAMTRQIEADAAQARALFA